MGLNRNTPARNDLYENVQYIRKDFTFSDAGRVLTVGTLPAGAVIVKAISGVHVSTAFNAGTANTLDIGTAADGDLYATALALGAVGPVALDEAVSQLVTVDTTVTSTPTLTGTAATTGAGQIVIAFVTRN